MLNILRRCQPALTLARKTPNINQSKSVGSESAAYDGDGRTTVNFLSEDNPDLNLVKSYSTTGFRITGDLIIRGSIILFPTNVFYWNVQRGKDITPESLFLFDIIVPKVRIVVIGYGSYGEQYDNKLALALKQKGINCEILPTRHAISTYNYLAADAIHVAGAFVPVLAPEEEINDFDAQNLQLEGVMSKKTRDQVYTRETVDSALKYHLEQRKDSDKKKFED